MDEEIEVPEFNPRERLRQQISVPFLWELKPGTPKREWISKPVSSIFSCPSPARLVVSVPFQWEEKPGKPLPDSSSSHVSSDHTDFPPSAYSLNPFVSEGEDYSLGFDLEDFAFPDDNHTNGSVTHNAGGVAPAREFPISPPPPKKRVELFPDDDHLTNPWVLPESTSTLGELMLLSRQLSCRRMPVDVKKNPSSMELIKKFLVACS